jgi:uncharacterized protein (DUF1697 family)
METYIAMLRGVNVGGRTLAMADLRTILAGLGLEDVRTYLQSGNAVFRAEPPDGGETGGGTRELAARIEVRIERDLGPRVAVLVLAAADLARVVAGNLFARDTGVEPSHLHVTFLFPPDDDFGTTAGVAAAATYKAAFDKLSLPAGPGERAAFEGVPTLASPVIYLHLPDGYGRSKLTNAYFERMLGTAATTRNWRTVNALADLASGQAD